MLICIAYLMMCLGVEVFIVVNIIDRLADRDYLPLVLYYSFWWYVFL